MGGFIDLLTTIVVVGPFFMRLVSPTRARSAGYFLLLGGVQSALGLGLYLSSFHDGVMFPLDPFFLLFAGGYNLWKGWRRSHVPVSASR